MLFGPFTCPWDGLPLMADLVEGGDSIFERKLCTSKGFKLVDNKQDLSNGRASEFLSLLFRVHLTDKGTAVNLLFLQAEVHSATEGK